MARDQSPRVRRRDQLARKIGQRASYDRILIVSEGAKTEPNYFCEIRAAYRLHTTNVEVRHCEIGTSPIQVVQYAESLFRNGDRHKRIQARAFEQVYAVFDRDDHDSYFDALQYAAALDGRLKNDIKQDVAFRAVASVPNFELWLLLHYAQVHAPVHRDEVLRRLKKSCFAVQERHAGRFCHHQTESRRCDETGHGAEPAIHCRDGAGTVHGGGRTGDTADYLESRVLMVEQRTGPNPAFLL